MATINLHKARDFGASCAVAGFCLPAALFSMEFAPDVGVMFAVPLAIVGGLGVLGIYIGLATLVYRALKAGDVQDVPGIKDRVKGTGRWFWEAKRRD